MFTGIIRHRGTVVSLTRLPSQRLVVTVPRLTARRGDSVAVDGVCLTVAGHREGGLVFDLLGETLRTTTLGARRPGDRVNVEPALKAGGVIGGHLVLGHVDAVGRVVRRRRAPAGIALTIAAPRAVRRYLAPKGAVAVDGVSVTLDARVTRGEFTIHLIPHTAAVTTLGSREPGDRVNLEADPIARYVVAVVDGAR